MERNAIEGEDERTLKRKETSEEGKTKNIDGPDSIKKRKATSFENACYNCGELGHHSRNCPKPRPYECMTCGSQAHSARFCPKRIEALEQDRLTLLQTMQYYQSPTGYPVPLTHTNYTPTGYALSPRGYATHYAPYIQPPHYDMSAYDPMAYGYSAGPPVYCLKCGKLGHRERDCNYGIVTPQTRCFNCNSKGHLAKDCKKGALPTTCYNCGEPGHLGRACPTAGVKSCFICKGHGHVAMQCPELPPRTCYNCGEDGHIGKHCTKPSTRPPAICYNCGETGHIGKTCPHPPAVCFKCSLPGHKAVDCPYGPPSSSYNDSKSPRYY